MGSCNKNGPRYEARIRGLGTIAGDIEPARSCPLRSPSEPPEGASYGVTPPLQQATALAVVHKRRIGGIRAWPIDAPWRSPAWNLDYRRWCSTRGIKPRFGAIGKYGSIAVVERFILSMKNEALRRLVVPLAADKMRAQLAAYFDWYNVERPHQFLDGATPTEVQQAHRPANKRRRLEPRARYPADASCAAPNVKAREVGCVLQLAVSGPQHLPVVRLKKAA